MLQLMPIEDPVFDPIVLPQTPPDFTMPETPALITAYATVLQDFIDNKIADFDAYYVAPDTLRQELQAVRDAVFRKYHSKRRDLLATAGKKNVTSMPGYLMRDLGEMLVEEKRDIGDAQVKIMQERLASCMDSIEWAVKAGIDSAALRGQTAQIISELNLEVLNDALKAGLSVVLQRVERANALIKEAGLLIEEETVRQRITNLSTIRLIAQQDVEKINLDILLYEIQAQGIGAELQVLAAKLVAAENEVLVLQAQIEKAMVETQVALAQEALANLKVITAQYERQKSDARMAAALLEDAKVNVRIAKVQSEEAKVAAQKQAELAQLALTAAQQKLDLLRDQMEVARTQASAAITYIKAQIEMDEAGNLQTRTGNINSFIGTRASHTSTTLGELDRIIQQAGGNIDDEVGQAGEVTGAITSTGDAAVADAAALAAGHSGNVTGYIALIDNESTQASGSADAQIASLDGLASSYKGNIDSLVTNIEQEARSAGEIIDQRAETIKTQAGIAEQTVDSHIAANEATISIQIGEAGVRISNMLSAAQTAASTMISEANSKSTQSQLDYLDKKDKLEADIEKTYGDWESKVKEIAQNKADAIIGAAENAANAKLTSKHTYIKG